MTSHRDPCAVAQWWAIVLLALLAPWSAATAAGPGPVALRGEWMAAEGPHSARTEGHAAQAFEPSRLQSFGRPAYGAWVRLHPQSGVWPAGRWVLSVESPGFQRITLHRPGEPPQQGHLLDALGGERSAFGRVAFDVPQLPAGGVPLRLHVDAQGVMPSPMRFALRTDAAQQAVETRWLALSTACLVIMLATAVIALVFGLRLRDAAFGWYAVYIVGYALIQAAQSGYLVAPLGWDALAAALPLWGRAVTALSVIAAVAFLDRFVELRRRLPRVRRVLQIYCALLLASMLIGYVPGLQVHARALINPLLILGGPLVLGVAAAAAWHGSRYALIFLLGWTPLLAVTVLGSLQLYGVAPGWTWTDVGGLATGAFEAIVLSLGLAERAASVRTQRDHAQHLADTDPLTGVMNRRAWRDAMRAAMAGGARGVSVLYLDLDHFKRVNDRLGHDGGDRLLQLFVDVVRVALRERDLVGRYGGEEFVVGLVDADQDEAQDVAERIRLGLRARSRVLESDVPLTVSIGVATQRAAEGLDELLCRADAALYAAKRDGRDRMVMA